MLIQVYSETSGAERKNLQFGEKRALGNWLNAPPLPKNVLKERLFFLRKLASLRRGLLTKTGKVSRDQDHTQISLQLEEENCSEFSLILIIKTKKSDIRV